MINVKCADCAEYRNEWCEKVIDSPHPDMLRNCHYFHERDRDRIKVTRCKDCKWWHDAPTSDGYNSCEKDALIRHEDFFCAAAERKEGEA